MRCANFLCPAHHRRLSDRDKQATPNIFESAQALAAGVPLPAHMVASNRHWGGLRPRPFFLMPVPLSSVQRPDVLEALADSGLLG
jgi:hypothetical protein